MLGVIVWVLLIGFIAVLVGGGLKARECYFCGDRRIVKYSRFKTVGMCSVCEKEGGKV